MIFQQRFFFFFSEKERDLDLGRMGWPFGAANISDLGDFSGDMRWNWRDSVFGIPSKHVFFGCFHRWNSEVGMIMKR